MNWIVTSADIYFFTEWLITSMKLISQKDSLSFPAVIPRITQQWSTVVHLYKLVTCNCLICCKKINTTRRRQSWFIRRENLFEDIMNLKRFSVMAPPFIKWAGRVAFFALLATQGGFLSAYQGQYKNSAWYAVCPSGAAMVWANSPGSCTFTALCCQTWSSFVLDDIDKGEFLGPNVLKMVLCLAPLLLLLLLTTADLKDESNV